MWTVVGLALSMALISGLKWEWWPPAAPDQPCGLWLLISILCNLDQKPGAVKILCISDGIPPEGIFTPNQRTYPAFGQNSASQNGNASKSATDSGQIMQPSCFPCDDTTCQPFREIYRRSVSLLLRGLEKYKSRVAKHRPVRRKRRGAGRVAQGIKNIPNKLVTK
jgi:hypothetical protein